MSFPRRARCPRNVRKTVHGFTLVELLVVIGIIALLMSILLPALNKARESARSVQCMSQERQIFMFCQMFANENKGRLPRGALIGEQGDVVNETTAWASPGTGLADLNNGALWRYIPSIGTRTAIIVCPSDFDERPHLNGDFQGFLGISAIRLTPTSTKIRSPALVRCAASSSRQ